VTAAKPKIPPVSTAIATLQKDKPKSKKPDRKKEPILSLDEDADTALEEELRWLRAEAVVWSASKKEEKLFETPAAAYVLTSEDIRRSGATTIHDALRMVPGLQVARKSASTWLVAARGIMDRWTGDLLVLVDGRSVYNPLNSA